MVDLVLILFLISILPTLIRFQITKVLSIAVDIKKSLTIKRAVILSECPESSYNNTLYLRSKFNIFIS